MSYYRKFRIVLGNPLWRLYLRWAYKKGICDLRKLGLIPKFNSGNFVCLLCGVGNETTADEFIEFVIARNPKARIIIIDIGDEQICAVKELVKKKYKSYDITIKKINALEIDNFIKNRSVDWIETDGFLEYFDEEPLEKLLALWAKILKPNGFITIREFPIYSKLDHIVDYIRRKVAKIWLRVSLYPLDKQKLENLFYKNHLIFASGHTPLPTYIRYTLVNKNSSKRTGLSKKL